MTEQERATVLKALLEMKAALRNIDAKLERMEKVEALTQRANDPEIWGHA